MIDEVITELKSGVEKAKDALKRDLAKLRTGRAHAGMLDSVRVDYYGQVTPIGQMATVSVPEPRLLTVKAWDKSQVQAISHSYIETAHSALMTIRLHNTPPETNMTDGDFDHANSEKPHVSQDVFVK